jgi:hypothetical protein
MLQAVRFKILNAPNFVILVIFVDLVCYTRYRAYLHSSSPFTRQYCRVIAALAARHAPGIWCGTWVIVAVTGRRGTSRSWEGGTTATATHRFFFRC